MGATVFVHIEQIPEPVHQRLAELTPPGLEVLLWQDLDESGRERALARCDFLLVASNPIGAAVFDRAPNLRFVQKTGVGVDNIDLDAARSRGVQVANTPGANAVSVAELTILHILAVYRRLLTVDTGLRRGEWMMWKFRASSFELHGKTHGVIGLGHVGKQVAPRSHALGTRVLYYDIRHPEPDEAAALGVEYADLPDLLARADVVSVHVPLDASTRHLIGAAELALMKPSAILVNVARGGVVDEAALVAAIRDGRLAGAGVDVWEPEPPLAEHPLFDLPTAVVTPHVGAGTVEAGLAMYRAALLNLGRVANGEQPEAVW